MTDTAPRPERRRARRARASRRSSRSRKRRGFIFPSSEIYGGINAVWDYGPLGVELKNNVKRAWWRAMVQERDDIVGLDSGILMHPQVWVTSGHVGRVQRPDGRVRHLPAAATGSTSSPGAEEPRSARSSLDPAIVERLGLVCPNDGGPLVAAAPLQPDAQDVPRPGRGRGGGRLPPARDGPGHLRQLPERPRHEPQEDPVRDRPDRQGVPQRDQPRQLRLPDARVRADGDAVLRPARTTRPRHFEEWLPAPEGVVRARTASRRSGSASASTRPTSWPTTPRRRSTSSTASRSAGRSSRASTTAATGTSAGTPEESGENLEYFDPATEEHFIPWIVETSAGADRAAFTFLIDAYREEEVRGEKRVVARAPPGAGAVQGGRAAAPQEAARDRGAVPPHHGRPASATSMAVYDDTAAIGKLYRRQDEIGTPWCVTVDVDSLEDGKVTVRDRDAMTQERIAPTRSKRAILDRLEAARPSGSSRGRPRRRGRPHVRRLSVRPRRSRRRDPACAPLG